MVGWRGDLGGIMSEWFVNNGRMPAFCKGKRICVELRNSMICGENPVADGSPLGWPADGLGGVRWSLDGHPLDIIRYRVL